MTTDSANSEREIVYQVCDVIRASHGHDCLRCERECSTPYGPGVHGCWLLAEQAIAEARKSESAELTSLRACVSRKDEEIEGLRARLSRIEAMVEHPNCPLCRDSVVHGHAQSASSTAQPSGRCAEGREEGGV